MTILQKSIYRIHGTAIKISIPFILKIKEKIEKKKPCCLGSKSSQTTRTGLKKINNASVITTSALKLYSRIKTKRDSTVIKHK